MFTNSPNFSPQKHLYSLFEAVVEQRVKGRPEGRLEGRLERRCFIYKYRFCRLKFSNTFDLLKVISCLFLGAFLGGCTKVPQEKNVQPEAPTLFTRLGDLETGIDFVNRIEDQKDFNILTFRNYYNGGGVAIGDINNDGLNDLYFTANMGVNKLYLNKGNLKFEDVTKKAGAAGSRYWSTGVTMADVNSDGWMDIYVCNSGDIKGQNIENELFINKGDGTFEEKAGQFGLNDSGYSTHAAFFDYDLDGDLDCFVLNNSYTDPQRIATVSRDRHLYGASGGDRLYRNDENVFTDVTESAGIYSGNIDFGLGVSVGDMNGDRYPDLYISNDFWERDYYYLNNGDGTFTEKLPDQFRYISANSMGSDIADLNNDGHNDVFSTDMLPASNYRMKSALMIEEYYLEDVKWRNSYFFQYIQNALHINNGDGTFKETAFYSGVAATDWSWGALIFDMNNDGRKDIFVSNGIYHDITDLDFVDFISSKEEIKKVVEKTGRSDFRDFVEYLPHNKQRNFAFINQGNLEFEDQASGLGLGEESYSNGAAYGDLDNDGDYDLVVNNVNMEAFVYENKSTNHNYLKVKLRGVGSNPFGIGTQVKLYSPAGVQVLESFTARGFQSSVDPDLIFGLSSLNKVDSLVVTWPDLNVQVIDGDRVSVNTTLIIVYKKTGKEFRKGPVPSGLFKENSSLVFKDLPAHQENDYLDYDHERLLLHASSTDGPKILTGDVNGDQNDDFVLLGASGQPDQLYIFRKGVYVKSGQVDLDKDRSFESVCGALFDADNDGDLDLLIGSGGNEYKRGYQSFTSRYYLNNGLGRFTRLQSGGPSFVGQAGCVEPCDFDQDGDLDLFIGGAGVPGNYGLIPRSFFLRNDGKNQWTDITTQETGPIGMVKDAAWSDVNHDGAVDLVVVGEWMPVTFFIQQNGRFVRGQQLPDSNGWWNTIEAGDLDGDGDNDFVLGNWGTNLKLKASSSKPLKLYVSDFDENGKSESILEWQFGKDNKAFPFAAKRDLTSQLPMLKKKALKYQEYAVKQVQDLLSAQQLRQATTLTTNTLNTSVLMDMGDHYELKELPFEAQLSPVYAVQIADIDQDGKQDLVLGGNYYKLKPEIGRLDGFDGGYFKGDGKGGFAFISAQKSGLKVLGEVRDIAILGEDKLIYARNNRSVISYKIK